MAACALRLQSFPAWDRGRVFVSERVEAMADEALMVRYRDGDVRAFEVLLGRHRKAVFNYILRFVHDPAQSEDLMQETFLRVIKAAHSYEQQSKFTTWLYTIARNLCVDQSRRARHRKAQSLDAPLDAEDGGATLLDVTADKKGQVDRAVIGKQLGERIQEAVARL